jgi:hypothetical protein
MGGDTGPAVMLAGAARAHGRRDDLQFLVFGDKARIRVELDKHAGLKDAVEIVHCDDVIAGTERPSQAIRRAKTTSMGQRNRGRKVGRGAGRPVGRQYRRADGNVQTRASHHARHRPPCPRRLAADAGRE